MGSEMCIRDSGTCPSKAVQLGSWYLIAGFHAAAVRRASEAQRVVTRAQYKLERCRAAALFVKVKKTDAPSGRKTLA